MSEQFLPHRELDPLSAENLDAEYDLVATIHEANHDKMQQIVDGEFESIEDKARYRFGIPDDQPLHLRVARGFLRNSKDEVYGDRLWINVIDYEKSDKRNRQLPVADVIHGPKKAKVYPLSSFGLKEAEIVLGMVKGLDEMAEQGVLRRLDRQSMTVSDPRTSIMELPKVTPDHKNPTQENPNID